MTDTTEREQIVAWLRKQAASVHEDVTWGKEHENLMLSVLACGQLMAFRQTLVAIERGDHLKESPHG